MPHAVETPATAREAVLLDHKLEITPVKQPLFALPNPSAIGPERYLTPSPAPFGGDVAKWQAEFFGRAVDDSKTRTECSVQPIRPEAPTLVALLYPQYEGPGAQRRSLHTYLTRLKRLASMNEQTIIYVPPTLSKIVRKFRQDEHWFIIDDFESVWDIPNNRHQYHNFTVVQPKLFAEFECVPGKLGWEPEPAYNNPHQSAVYLSLIHI